MDVQHLIQAHKLYANWSRTGPEVDLDNAYSMAFLSMIPAVSPAELQERRTALEAIWERQADRAKAAEANLMDSGVDLEAVKELVLRISEAASSATLMFALAHLMARQDAAASKGPSADGAAASVD